MKTTAPNTITLAPQSKRRNPSRSRTRVTEHMTDRLTDPDELLATHTTPLGTVYIAVGDAGLRGLWFDGQKHFENQKNWQNTHFVQHPWQSLLQKTQHWLDGYFSAVASKRLSFPPFDGPLDLSGGTEFQQMVWRALLRIGSGQTATYGAVAASIARPSAVRAVGAAVGRNPISIVVPCHRVLGTNGALTGYAGGLHRKTALLTIEGALPRPLQLPPQLPIW